jgi:hypothetical protein
VAAIAGELGTLAGVVVVMSEVVAFQAAAAAPGLFPQGVAGGIYGLVPVLLSETAEDNLVAVHQRSVLYADDGGLEFDSSGQAALETSEEPAHDSSTPTPAQLVSMWQSNSRALKVSRTINFELVREGAAQVVEGADYTGD